MTTAAAFTAADLSFEATLHNYRLPDGRRVPSVTEILGATGVALDFDELAGLSHRLGLAISDKRDLGQTLHTDAHSLDDDDLIWATVDPRVLPYLNAWKTFRENSGLEPISRERRVFHAAQGYAGTLDGVFLHPNGKHILGDLKVGDPWDAACHLQTAAYEAAYLTEHPDEIIHERWGIQLCPELKIPYRVTNYSARPNAWLDYPKFQACVTVFNEQPARRRAA